MERLDEGLGAFDARDVAAVVERIEGPAEACAGLLGDPKAHDPVVPAPDQRNGHADLLELIWWDPPYTDPPQQLTVGRTHARLGSSVDVVRLERLPALTSLRPYAVGIEEHLAREPLVGGRARAPDVAYERGQRAPGAGRKGPSEPESTRTIPRSRSPCSIAKWAAKDPPSE